MNDPFFVNYHLRDKRVKIRPGEYIEPQEVILDSIAQQKEKEWGISERKFEVPLSPKTIWAFNLTFLALFLLLFGKTFFLQVFEGKTLFSQAESNRLRIYLDHPNRGVIYDRNGKQLVFNESNFDLVLDKRDLPQPGPDSEREKILARAAELIGKNLTELKSEIEESKEEKIIILENISHENLLALEPQISQEELPGFSIEQNFIRKYENGEIFSQVIGYMGKINETEYETIRDNPEEARNYSITDYVGKSGLEKYYDKALRGKPGILEIEKDALGSQKSEKKASDPESGNSLVLWLDSGLQEQIYKQILSTLQQTGSKKAAAVALDPKTGGVLALVSVPGFDNNLFSKGSDPKNIAKILENPLQPLFNRAISGQYLTGSAIKPLIATGVLEEKIISPDKKINCHGYISIPHQYDPNLETIKNDWNIHGWTDMRKAIAESCDVYFYTVGGGYQDQKGLGPTKIKEYLDRFGWEKLTGIDLPGEVAGFVPDKDWKKNYFQSKQDQIWYDGDTYNLAIGQGYLKVTPLEVAASFVAIANGGKIFQPKVVKETIDKDKNVIESFQLKIISENFVNSENIKIVREGMRWAVTGQNSPLASSAILNSLPVSVAAKTGTAELGGDRYNNWVALFAPYDDPQIVLVVVLEDVRGVQAGALPIAREVLNWFFTR